MLNITRNAVVRVSDQVNLIFNIKRCVTFKIIIKKTQNLFILCSTIVENIGRKLFSNNIFNKLASLKRNQ